MTNYLLIYVKYVNILPIIPKYINTSQFSHVTKNFLTLNKMVFHSHYMVTDKKTGIIHSLCCYKECCNSQVTIKDENPKKVDNIIVNNNTSKDFLPKSDDKSIHSLSKYKKDEKIRVK